MELLCIETHVSGRYTLVVAGQTYSHVNTHHCKCGLVAYNVGVPLPANTHMVCTCDEFISATDAYHKPDFFVEIGSTDEHEQYVHKEPVTIIEKF